MFDKLLHAPKVSEAKATPLLRHLQNDGVANVLK
jgi:hypothetical protein